MAGKVAAEATAAREDLVMAGEGSAGMMGAREGVVGEGGKEEWGVPMAAAAAVGRMQGKPLLQLRYMRYRQPSAP